MGIIITFLVFVVVIGIWILNIITPITLVLWFLTLLNIININRIGTILLIELGLWFIFFILILYADVKGALPNKR